ncbi:MAG: FtsX-like permease family protein [Aeromicrobium sp.]
MLTLVLRRALAQRALLAGVVALVTLGTTVLGVGSLLLDTTQVRAFAAAAQQQPREDVDVTAFLVDVPATDLAGVREDAEDVVGDVLAPLRPTVTSTAVSRMRRTSDGKRLAYLASTDTLRQRAILTSGRWPAAPGEAVVPGAAASRLGLQVGGRVTLGREVGSGPNETPVTVEVVGTFRPSTRAGWASDPLTGRGYDASYSDGAVTAPAAGPFVVDGETFAASASNIASLQVTGAPVMALASDASMTRVADALGSADTLLGTKVGDRVQISRVASELPQTLTRLRTQQSATGSTVLVVLLLATSLAATALLLAGRLLARVRGEERVLLTGLGLARRQLVALSLAEAAMLAAAAAILAVPAAALTHAMLTHLPGLSAAGLGQRPAATGTLLLTVTGGALGLALALVVPVLGRPVSSSRAPTPIRSGAGVLLVVLAVGAWWQLRSPASATDGTDVVRVLAPVVCVVAATAAAVRLVPLTLGLIAGRTGRSTGLVLPLATHQAARRPHVGGAFALIALATVAAALGVAVHSTWDRSQADQAATRVGTDLALRLSAPPTIAEATAVSAAARGASTSGITDRPLALGSYVGTRGEPPRLVALDAARAGSLVRGRLDGGRTWAGIGRLLAPSAPVSGVRVTPGRITVTGTPPDGTSAEAAVTLVVEGPSGVRQTVTGSTVPLDGRPRTLDEADDLAGSHIVAVRLALTGGPSSATGTSAAATVDVTVPSAGSTAAAPRDWHVHLLDEQDGSSTAADTSSRQTSGTTTVSTRVRLDPAQLEYGGVDLVASIFAPPTELPIAMSRQLADALGGVSTGGRLSATVDLVDLPLRVEAVVPTVPSAPGRPAVLADADTLSRLLISKGQLDTVVDGWWIGEPQAGTARALKALDLGDVVTRSATADQLRRGPLQATVTAALVLLVVAAGLMLLAGAGLVVGADRPSRSAEVARLRAMGATRRAAARIVLVELTLVLGVLVLTGLAVGAAAAAAVGPDLVLSDTGRAPVPPATWAWPWATEATLALALLAGVLVVVAASTRIVVGRSGPDQLRAGDS